MKRLITGLGLLLGLQIILALAFNLGGRHIGRIRPGQPLLAFKPARIDGIVIDRPGQPPLKLQRHGGNWRLPGLFGFPASKDKVAGLRDKLLSLRPRLAVTTSAAGVERFKTGAKDFRRKIELLSGKKTLATLYLGRADGAHRSYARVAGSRAVYEVPLGGWQASVKPDGWLDHNHLALKQGDITGMQLSGITLKRKGGSWQLAGLKKGENTDQETANRLVSGFAELVLSGVFGTENKAAYHQDKPLLSATVTLKSGTVYRYTFSVPQGDAGDYVLKRSDGPWYMKVGRDLADPLKAITRKDLIATAKKTSSSAHAAH